MSGREFIPLAPKSVDPEGEAVRAKIIGYSGELNDSDLQQINDSLLACRPVWYRVSREDSDLGVIFAYHPDGLRGPFLRLIQGDDHRCEVYVFNTDAGTEFCASEEALLFEDAVRFAEAYGRELVPQM